MLTTAGYCSQTHDNASAGDNHFCFFVFFAATGAADPRPPLKGNKQPILLGMLSRPGKGRGSLAEEGGGAPLHLAREIVTNSHIICLHVRVL